MRFASTDTAIGTVIAGVNDKGVCCVRLRTAHDVFLAEHPDARHDEQAVANILRQLRRYLIGEDVSLDSIPIDPAGTDFQRRVWQALRGVPRGQVISYGDLAARSGKPGAARAVGSAMARNPVPLIVPCHRVVKAGGSIGNFGSGVDLKRYLLTLEGVPLKD